MQQIADKLLIRIFRTISRARTKDGPAAWLWRQWKEIRLQAVLNAVLGLLAVGFSLLSVGVMQHAIDVATHDAEGSLWRAVAMMGAVTIGEFGLQVAHTWVKNILGVKAQNRLQQKVLGRLLESEWHPKNPMHSGDAVNRLTQDVTQVVNFLTETVPSTLSTLTMLCGAFFYLFGMDRMLAVIVVTVLPVFMLLSRFYMSRMRRLTRLVRQSDSNIQSIITESLSSAMLLKTLEATKTMLLRLDSEQTVLRGKVRRRTAFSVASNLFVTVGFAGSYLTAFLWGALRMQAGTLTFGGMTAFLQLVGRIQSPARSLTRLAPAFVSVLTAAERIIQLESQAMEIQGEKRMMKAPMGLRLENVCFQYEDGGRQTSIENLCIEFAPQTVTAVTGSTGSGKTTLLRLLLSLLSPSEGRILICDGEGREEALTPLHRCNFVYVPQGNTLLSGTIRDNMLLASPSASDDEIREALEKACAEFVFELPDGLDTLVAEHGGGLSEGQAQRLAIARSLLRPGSIMLLDEATSALDSLTERRLLDNLLAGGTHTVVLVTHREAALSYADAVVRL